LQGCAEHHVIVIAVVRTSSTAAHPWITTATFSSHQVVSLLSAAPHSVGHPRCHRRAGGSDAFACISRGGGNPHGIVPTGSFGAPCTPTVERPARSREDEVWDRALATPCGPQDHPRRELAIRTRLRRFSCGNRLATAKRGRAPRVSPERSRPAWSTSPAEGTERKARPEPPLGSSEQKAHFILPCWKKLNCIAVESARAGHTGPPAALPFAHRAPLHARGLPSGTGAHRQN